MSNVVSVSLGAFHSAVITESGDLYTWGLNSEGQLGDGTTTNSYKPIHILSNVVSVSLGYCYSAAITENGDLYTWGNNEYGQLGNETYDNCYSPQKIMSNIAYVCAGYHHSAALTKSGVLYTWGWNCSGQLGIGTGEWSRSTPTKIILPESVTATVNLYNSANTLNETGAQSSFNGLLPNTIYNFYIMKDRLSENSLSSDNLIYINQGVTDQNGNITFEYSADGTDFESAKKFVMPIKHFLPDSAIGGTVITSATDKVTLNVLNTDLNGYNNIFARFTVGEESFDISEYTAYKNGLQFICNVGGGLPENSIISVQLFASYQGVQYQSSLSSCLLIDARCNLDGDGGVGALDTALLKQTLLGAASVAQDVNGDGKADILDLVHLKKYLAEIV